MTTYRELQDELERLHLQQQKQRRNDRSAALARIRSWMAEYGITPDELGELLAAERPA